MKITNSINEVMVHDTPAAVVKGNTWRVPDRGNWYPVMEIISLMWMDEYGLVYRLAAPAEVATVDELARMAESITWLPGCRLPRR